MSSVLRWCRAVSSCLTLVALSLLLGGTPARAHAQGGSVTPLCVSGCISYSVAVTPDGGTLTVAPGGSYSTTFTVSNTGDGNDTYTLTCGRAGGVTCGTVSPSSVTLDAGGPLAPAQSSSPDGSVSPQCLNCGGGGGGTSATITVHYTTAASGSTSGTLHLTATSSHASDQGTRQIAIVAPPVPGPPVATVADPMPGPTIDRSLCVMAGLEPEVAYQCGDLRLIHALPTLTTYNKARTPVLFYGSAQAHPYPLVGVNVGLPLDRTVPDTIEVVLKVSGIELDRVRWAGSEWQTGQTRRVAVGFHAMAAGLPTGIYDYTAEVALIYGSARYADTATGKLDVLDRHASPFGAGWWLAGLEHLDVGSMVWTGGDGSMHQYLPTGIPNVWAGPAVGHPDTLRLVGSEYIRQLPHGIAVTFDAAGRHVRTTDRLGHQTLFGYDGSGRLQTITLPVPPGSPARTYAFAYGTSTLASVTASAGVGSTRTTSFGASGVRLTAITDPDGHAVHFGYDGGWTSLVLTRTNRRGAITTFTYDDAYRLIGSSLDMGPGRTAHAITFTPAETQGLMSANHIGSVDTANVRTIMDGPRLPADVADVTTVWLDRFGGPRKIRNALGGVTLLTRGDSRWPALVTREQSPSGQITGAVYDARGNLVSVTDSSTYIGGRYATTTYEWDPKWDFMSSVVQPLGEQEDLAYDPATGNRLWQQDGRGSMSRITFAYNALGLLSAVESPISPADSVGYDNLGNLWLLRSPAGFRTYHYKDAFGRDTLVLNPLDSAQTTWRQDFTTYDLMGRKVSERAVGPATTFASAPQTLEVRTYYDAEGNVDSLSRRAAEDPNNIGWLTTRYQYDLAGQRVAEIAPDHQIDSTTYDPAGNPIVHVTRRHLATTATFDAMNRVTRRITPSVTYGQETWGTWTYPRIPIGSSTGIVIPGDTAVFSYDAGGNVVQADNGAARIRRSYGANGSLLSDSLRIRTYPALSAGGNFTTHVYGIKYGYDLDGRLSWEKHPSQLAPRTLTAPTVPKDSATYSYGVDGRLASVTDVLGDRFEFHYNADGVVDTVYFPGGVIQADSFDPDGRIVDDMVSVPLLGWDTSFTDTPASHAGLQYEVGKLRHASELHLDTYLGYSGLGMLAYSHIDDRRGGNHYTESTGSGFDALGNEVWRSFRSINCRDPLQDWEELIETDFTYDGVGRQSGGAQGACMENPPMDGGPALTYDAAGNQHGRTVISEIPYVVDTGDSASTWETVTTNAEHSVSYYDAEEHLRFLDREREPSEYGDEYGTFFEEYRYDALGRRVLKRSIASWACDTGTYCKSAIERYVWDGDQLLYEMRYPGYTDVTAADLERDTTTIKPDGRYYGRVAYTHGTGLDRPLNLIRMGYGYDWGDGKGYGGFGPVAMSMHYNWHGDVDLLPLASGAARRCLPDLNTFAMHYRCVDVWLAAKDAFFRPQYKQPKGGASWYGGLLRHQADASGQVYMRNRYYDPETGRFTQEDPIGVAGGVNVYGYAGGDPVSYSDPFGLDTLSNKERAALGNTCLKVDCGTVRVYRGEDGPIRNALRRAILTVSKNRAVTLGWDVYLPDADAHDLPTLAHELTHFGQFERWGSVTYYRRAIQERLREAHGGDPYALPEPLPADKPFGTYGMEQQGQIVQNCFAGLGGCRVSPYQPPR